MKIKMLLSAFSEAVLPLLEAQHKSPADLQKAINDGYELTDDAGAAVQFEVKSAAAPAQDSGLTADTISKAVATAVKEAIKGFQPAAPINEPTPDIQVKGISHRNLKSFRGAKSEEKAYTHGQFWKSFLFNDAKSAQWCKDHGVVTRAMSEAVNSAGGFGVPEQVETDIINLKEQYGVIRQIADVKKMVRDRATYPIRTAGLTTYYIGENPSAITQSNPTLGQAGLTTKTLASLTLMSRELSDDNAINLGDFISGEIAYAQALAEDTAAFQGIGNATTGGIQGLPSRLTTIHGTSGTSGYGLQVSTSGTWAAATLADFHATIGILPAYARPGARWVCSMPFFATVMQRLAYAQGGTTVDQAQNGTGMQFLGFPVTISQAMIMADGTANTVSALLGDFSLGCLFGDRMQTEVAVSTERYFDTNQIGIRGLERYDLNFHSPGVASTSSGPIVGLIVA